MGTEVRLTHMPAGSDTLFETARTSPTLSLPSESNECQTGTILQDNPTASNDVSLGQLTLAMASFAREREWEQFHSPRNLLLALVRRSCYGA